MNILDKNLLVDFKKNTGKVLSNASQRNPGFYFARFWSFCLYGEGGAQDMASWIAGITVEIGGDTTNLSSALKDVNSNIKSTQTQLKDVEKLLKLDPTNVQLITQKQKLLTQEIEAAKEKLTTLKTAAEQANEQLQKGEITQE